MHRARSLPVRTGSRAAFALAVLVAGACSDDAGGGTGGPDAGVLPTPLEVEVALPDGTPAGTRLRAIFKRDRPARAVIEADAEIDVQAASTRVWLLAVPDVPGDAPTLVSLRLEAKDAATPVAVGYAAIDAASDTALSLLPYRLECDRDGDGQLTCAGDCCEALPLEIRPSVLDCLDDTAEAYRIAARNAGGLLLADAKHRRASSVGAFRPAEAPEDYFECENGLDDDCAGGDVPCTIRTDADQDGAPLATDCDDSNPDISPRAVEIPGDGVDQNCDGRDAAGTDRDLDGYLLEGGGGGGEGGAARDCDDQRPDIAPGRAETRCDGVDQDCDGVDLCAGAEPDADGDGHGGPTGDCDETDPGVNPSAAERCGDGVDQDCDGEDRACARDDADGDGHGSTADDCDDTRAEVFRGAAERCDDGVDQDCDGADVDCDDGVDRDGDAFPVPGDCDDLDPSRHPDAAERCDGRDEDCDGLVDEGRPELNAAGEGVGPCQDACGSGRWSCMRGGPVCELATPRAERCDGSDDDCDGAVDEQLETLCFDGPAGARDRGVCRPGEALCLDGVSQPCTGQVLPAEGDPCNGLDDDCDGRVDGDPSSCYDGPEASLGRGRCHAGVQACEAGVPGRCVGQVVPEAEVCDGQDGDCDGAVDEGLVEPCAADGEAPPECRMLVRRCVDGAWGVCEPERGGALEACDAVDNDCDGAVDEGFEVFSDDENCGVCGLACAQGERCCAGVCRDVDLCPEPDLACDDDADCALPASACVEGRCQSCRPLGHEGCDGDQLCCAVAGILLACVPGSPHVACEACGAPCEARSASGCVERACQCGDGPACEGETPYCDADAGRCVACLGDADCDGDFDGNQCVGGACRPCDPADHVGCGDAQLCCRDRCVATAADAGCETCDSPCEPGRADTCEARTCLCGDGDACDDAAPFCESGACAACRAGQDADCGAPGLRCEAGACVGCGAGGGTCPPAGPRPVCDGVGVCRPCAGDADCGDNELGHQCVDGRCRSCDPADAAGCLPASGAPTCDAETSTCRACVGPAECPAERAVCVAGRCETCDVSDHTGCVEAGEEPVCVDGLCLPCVSDGDCETRPGDRDVCQAGRCVACRSEPAAGCAPDGTSPICDALGAVCRSCRDANDCMAGGLGARCLATGACSD